MKKSAFVLAAAACLAAAGCSDSGNQAAANEQGNASTNGSAAAGEGTIVSALRGNSDVSSASALVDSAGLTSVLEGVGPYTVFAPTNAALEGGLGEQRLGELRGEAMRPQAVALLRAHIVPGVLTRRDIQAAIEAAHNEPVQMRTMADTMLTFSREGESILVSTADGARARLTGDESTAGNGAVQPIDGLLRRAEAPYQ
ncbi:MAG: fasciclin domain-containing protein [Allosphingosinicella sp.]|uniref:fasciclin domain-containing protein n=1 Tax=Allosphingosinicella sp. TaxID=2823234 RepID=UPI00392477A0